MGPRPQSDNSPSLWYKLCTGSTQFHRLISSASVLTIVRELLLVSTKYHKKISQENYKTMKFFSLATSITLPATSSTVFAQWPNDWHLDVYLADGGHAYAHGRLNSGCVNWNLDIPRSPVTRAVFQEGTFACTFELYEARDCNPPISYRENGGEHTLTPPRTIRSYKVY
jgi:hypothetical protein